MRLICLGCDGHDDSCEAYFVDKNHPMYNDFKAHIWTLKHNTGNDTNPYFYIEKPFGEKRPRLVACN